MVEVQLGGLLEAHVFIDTVARVLVVKPCTRGGGVTGEEVESQERGGVTREGWGQRRGGGVTEEGQSHRRGVES